MYPLLRSQKDQKQSLRIFETDKRPSKDPREVPPRSFPSKKSVSSNLKDVPQQPPRELRVEFILIRFENVVFV